MLNDRALYHLAAQHRDELLQAAERERLAHEALGNRHVAVREALGALGHRLAALVQRAERKPVAVHRH